MNFYKFLVGEWLRKEFFIWYNMYSNRILHNYNCILNVLLSFLNKKYINKSLNIWCGIVFLVNRNSKIPIQSVPQRTTRRAIVLRKTLCKMNSCRISSDTCSAHVQVRTILKLTSNWHLEHTVVPKCAVVALLYFSILTIARCYSLLMICHFSLINKKIKSSQPQYF